MAEGADVVAGSLSTDNLDGLDRVAEVCGECAGRGGPVRLVQKAIDEHGRLDVLVNVGESGSEWDGFLPTSDEDSSGRSK